MPNSDVKPESPPEITENKPRANFLLRLGPGLITGAADDDPSGIGTYSQVGAQFGTGMLWTMLFSFPLMAAIQEICARIGRITGAGVAANVRKCYPRPILYAVVLFLCVANIFNLGADITAMGAAAHLVFRGSVNAYAMAFGLISLLLQVFVPYKRYVRYLKWLTIVLFAYVATAFVVHVPVKLAIRGTFIPDISWTADYWIALVALLGTTISPYLFFWQTSQEAEEVRVNKDQSPLKRKPLRALAQLKRIALDTRVGMALSNLIAFFIILTTASTLHASGHASGIQTAADAAKALQPLAGKLAFLLFALGIIGTGLLAVPVLAGSAAYTLGETFRWPVGLSRPFSQARGYYASIAAITLLGAAINAVPLDAFSALVWAAVVNGLVAVPVMVVVVRMGRDARVMGKFVISRRAMLLGWITTAVMALAAAGMIATSLVAR